MSLVHFLFDELPRHSQFRGLTLTHNAYSVHAMRPAGKTRLMQAAGRQQPSLFHNTEVAVLGSSGTVTLAASFPMVCVASLACVGGVVGLLVDGEGETSSSIVELVSCWKSSRGFLK